MGMDKAPDAFRTISEVADVLDTPAHVLRFWESRFPQIKPVKRAGGRRYYRPADVALLSGIRQLLHAEGMTIRGVQKILREQGVRHVAALAGDLSVEVEDEAILDPVGSGDAAPVSAEIHQMPPQSARDATTEPGRLAEVQPLFPDDVAQVADTWADTAVQAAGSTSGLPYVEPSAETPQDSLPPDSLSPAAEVQPLFPEPRATMTPALPFDLPPDLGSVPREGEGGFIAFTTPRRPPSRPRPVVDDGDQPTLPFDTSPADRPEEAPEAPHLWVEVEEAAQAPATLHAFVTPEDIGQSAATAFDDAEDDGVPVDDTLPGTPDALTLTEAPAAAAVAADAGPIAWDIQADPDTEAPMAVDVPLLDDTPKADAQAQSPAHLEKVVALAGVAARLRGLGVPFAKDELAELHSRLGLLHAQMAEAVRLRR